jgi:hypothetical protein
VLKLLAPAIDTRPPRDVIVRSGAPAVTALAQERVGR